MHPCMSSRLVKRLGLHHVMLTDSWHQDQLRTEGGHLSQLGGSSLVYFPLETVPARAAPLQVSLRHIVRLRHTVRHACQPRAHCLGLLPDACDELLLSRMLCILPRWLWPAASMRD